jgi:hypothetical protein
MIFRIQDEEALYDDSRPKRNERKAMFAEKLSLEVGSTKLGWEVVKPRKIRGISGIEHSFSFVTSSGRTNYAFDIYDQVTEVEVMKSYLKKYDTEAIVNLVSTKGTANPGAQRLATEYGMEILSPDEILTYFSSALVERQDIVAQKQALLSP